MNRSETQVTETEHLAPPTPNLLYLHRKYFYSKFCSGWLLQESSLRVFEAVEELSWYFTEVAHANSETGCDDYAEGFGCNSWQRQSAVDSVVVQDGEYLYKLEPISDQDLRFFVNSVANDFIFSSEDPLDAQERFLDWRNDTLIPLTNLESARLNAACEDVLASGIFLGTEDY